MIGRVKGYDICVVTVGKLNKDGFLDSIISKESGFKEKLLDILKNKGYIIGLKKKKVLKVLYIFEMNKEEKTLSFSESLKVDDVEPKTIEEFEKVILEELKEKLFFDELTKIDWNDIEINPKKFFGFSESAFSLCLSLGVMYGILFDHLAVGIVFGICIGLCFGVVVKKK